MAAWGPLSSHPIVVADTRSVGESAHAGQTDDAAATRASASAPACHRNFGGGAGTAEAVPLAPATAKVSRYRNELGRAQESAPTTAFRPMRQSGLVAEPVLLS